jgi:hypothetical protein
MECPSLEKTHRLEPSFTNAVHLPRSLELLDHNFQSDSMLLPQAEAGAADAVPPRMIYNPSFDSNIFLKHLVTLLTLHSAPFKLWNPYILSPPSSPLRAMDATDTKEKTSPTVSSNKIDNIEGHNHVGYERSTVVAGAGNLKRQLKPRHLAMISIGKFFCVVTVLPAELSHRWSNRNRSISRYCELRQEWWARWFATWILCTSTVLTYVVTG